MKIVARAVASHIENVAAVFVVSFSVWALIFAR